MYSPPWQVTIASSDFSAARSVALLSGDGALPIAGPGPPAFYFEAEQLSKENMQKRLEELYQRTPSAEIIIKADQRLKYGDVKEVMKMAKEAGFQNVGLIADKKQKGAGKS